MIRIFFFLLAFTTGLSAQDFTTHTYHTDDKEELALDLFLPAGDAVTPLVIFVHGGGFSGGDRSGGHALGRALQKRGIATASISYTLYMKGRTQDWSCDGILPEKIKTIQIAANQSWLATKFLIDKAEAWNIDPEAIFLAGSSAGGETVLHAGYFDRKQMALYDHGLPTDFRYAGIISGAGAIMDLNLITPSKQVPALLFHGDDDPLVPYAAAPHHSCPPNASGWLMLFGSASVAKRHEQLDGDFFLITFAGAGHEKAGYYFYQKQRVIADFIDSITGGTHLQIRQTIRKE